MVSRLPGTATISMLRLRLGASLVRQIDPVERKLKAGPEHANHRVGRSIKSNRAAENSNIPREAPGPKRFTNQNYWPAAGAIFLRAEGTAKNGSGAKYSE